MVYITCSVITICALHNRHNSTSQHKIYGSGLRTDKSTWLVELCHSYLNIRVLDELVTQPWSRQIEAIMFFEDDGWKMNSEDDTRPESDDTYEIGQQKKMVAGFWRFPVKHRAAWVSCEICDQDHPRVCFFHDHGGQNLRGFHAVFFFPCLGSGATNIWKLQHVIHHWVDGQSPLVDLMQVLHPMWQTTQPRLGEYLVNLST